MTQEGAVPPSYNEHIRRVIREEIAAYARSGSSRNMSIGEGGTLTIRGGQLRVLYPEAEGGEVGVYFGDVSSDISGTYLGTGLLIQDADGSDIASFRSDVSGHPLAVIRDGQQNAVFFTDTSTGQGMGRPSLSGGFAAAQFADFTCSTASTTFVTVADQWVTRQQPRLELFVRSSMDTAGATGELRVMVDNVQLGATAAQSFAVTSSTFSGAVAGNHMDLIHVEIQACVVTGPGALRVEPVYWRGRQS